MAHKSFDLKFYDFSIKQPFVSFQHDPVTIF